MKPSKIILAILKGIGVILWKVFLILLLLISKGVTYLLSILIDYLENKFNIKKRHK